MTQSFREYLTSRIWGIFVRNVEEKGLRKVARANIKKEKKKDKYKKKEHESKKYWQYAAFS